MKTNTEIKKVIQLVKDARDLEKINEDESLKKLFFMIHEEIRERVGNVLVKEKIDAAVDVLAYLENEYEVKTIEEAEESGALDEAIDWSVDMLFSDLAKWLAENASERMGIVNEIMEEVGPLPIKKLLQMAQFREVEKSTRAVIDAYKKWTNK